MKSIFCAFPKQLDERAIPCYNSNGTCSNKLNMISQSGSATAEQREVRCKSVATIITVIGTRPISRDTLRTVQVTVDLSEICCSIFGYEKCSRLMFPHG